MSDIKVTFGEIQDAQANIAATSQRINQELEDLRRFLQPMVSSWTGRAAEDYQSKQRQWDQAATDLDQVLAQIGTALGQANQNYQQAERANAQRWS